jgi:hypothetical protein
MKGKKELVCKMKKSLYGLNNHQGCGIKNLILICWDLDSQGVKSYQFMYFKLIGYHLIYLLLYVYDMLLIGNDKEIIQDVKTQLSSKFDMKDIHVANFILGMEIKRDRAKRKLWLN